MKYTKEQQRKHRKGIKIVGKISIIIGLFGLLTINEHLPLKELFPLLAIFYAVTCIGFILCMFIDIVEEYVY